LKYLRFSPTIFDLTGVQALVVRVLHTGINPGAAKPHRVDGSLITETRAIRNYLITNKNAAQCEINIANASSVQIGAQHKNGL